jgi:signal peptidase I
MTRKKKKDGRQPWRENLEALAMAVAVAMLFKIFVLEVSRIPSGSMQPTLMGNPETQVFDRVLVDKLSFQFRDPKRWEIVVFKHPIERSRVMVKRLVGMPGEQLKIDHGDLWTRASDTDEWRVQRRPDSVQREMWRRVDSDDPKRVEWKVVHGGEAWRMFGGGISARGSGRARFRSDQGPIQNVYSDGYPETLRNRIKKRSGPWVPLAVGDVRLAGELLALPGTTSVLLQLTEGQRTYKFRLPGPAADSGAAPEIVVLDSGLVRAPDGSGLKPPPDRTERGATWRLPADERVSFAVHNLDDRLRLEVDGDTLLEIEISANDDQRTFVDVAVEGEGAELTDLALFRDIHYLPHRGSVWEQSIPDEHYVMLGDNTQDSADSRDWEAVSFTWDDANGGEPTKVRGNYRKRGENPTPTTGAGGVASQRFKDEWGEVRWIAKDEAQMGLPYTAPFVPRHLIQGRAVLVFWPLKPWRGLWRLSWLH